MLEWLKCWSHGPPLILDGSIGFRSLSSKLRKYLPLKSAAWKSIFYWERIKLHSVFLQKFQDDLHGNDRIEVIFLVSLSTEWCNGHCNLLGQSQNSIWLQASLEKNSLSSWDITVKWIWYRWTEESKILFVAWRESVITTMWLLLEMVTAWFMPHWIVNNSASVVVTLIALCIVLTTGFWKE